MVLGTAAYMAPEQLEGGETTPSTDIYALAVVAYESLTGEKAREGRTPLALAHQIATSPPPDLRERLPDASPQAAELLRRGMARDPGDRPASAGELASGLARALEEPPTAPTRAVPPTRTEPRPAPVAAAAPAPAAAKPPPPTGPSRRPDRGRGKRPIGAIVLALVLLALAAATVIAAVLSSGDDGGEPEQANRDRQQQTDRGNGQERRQQQQQEQAPAQPDPAPEESEPPPAEEQEGSFDPARGAALNEEGFALMQQGDYAGAVPILQDAVASWPEDSTDINYAYALYNLGTSLNRSGNPEEAIPYLEKRLNWNDQRETVQAELDLAKRKAGQE
jgi:eukaryotic-like serine/threonine-protein kinase